MTLSHPAVYLLANFVDPLRRWFSALASNGARPSIPALLGLALFVVPVYALQGTVESVTRPTSVPTEPSPIRARIAHANILSRTVSLPAISSDLTKSAGVTSPGTPQRIGLGRDLGELDSMSKFASALNWQPTLSGGMVGAVTISVPQATGTRLGLRVDAVPPTAMVRFYAPSSASAFEISGQSIWKLIQANLDAGDSDDMAKMYWGPFIDGENVTLEIELPAGVNPTGLQLAIPKLTHFFQSPNSLDSSGQKSGQVGSSQSCEIDAMCYSQSFPEINAIGQMSFVGTDGQSHVCSGTLLNDKSAGYIPYFLSANHCISKQSVASTLQTNWFFHSTSCNSGVVNPSYRTTYGGATLLYASTLSDTSFMRLNDTPPAGAMYAGWSSVTPAIGTAVTALHHPSGDLEKISLGSLDGFFSCGSSDPVTDTFSCSSSTQSAGNFFNILFSSGTVEGGSSGSGVFKTVSGSNYLVGQLRGGASSCTNLSGSNRYGRFDVAYSAALSKWLDSGTSFVLAVSNLGNGKGTITSSQGGISCGNLCSATLAAGTSVVLTASPSIGSTFTGWSGACTGASLTCTVSVNSSLNVSATFGVPTISIGAALDNSVLTFSNDPLAPFFGQTAISNYGGSALQTGHIGNSQSTSLSTVISGPGTMTFDWKVSSEKSYDIFRVYLDGVSKLSWSGETNWYTSTLVIPAGSHTVQWTYSKDSSGSSGLDAGWLDHVYFTPAAVLNNLVNPGFESGATGWTVSSANSGSLIANYANPITLDNQRMAKLCGYNNCADSLSQKVTIPADANFAYLDFWYFISTAETTIVGIYDWLVVEIRDAVTSASIGIIKTLSNLDAGSNWQHTITDFSKFIGKTINLVFRAQTDGTNSTSFYLDPVKLMVDGSGGVERGWWWNPAEGGRGFAIEKLGNKIFMAGFLYNDVGRPTWFTATGEMSGNVFTAPIRLYSNGQTLSGAYVAPTQLSTSPGNVSLNFSDPTHAVMTWPGGTVVLQRFEIVPGSLALPAPSFLPERGWWWNASEGGRGYALEIQGDNMFIAGFMYDANGQPAWYVSTGKMTDSHTYIGNWIEYSGGQTMTGPYKSPASNKPVASIGINFPDAQHGNLYLPNEIIPITRFTSF